MIKKITYDELCDLIKLSPYQLVNLLENLVTDFDIGITMAKKISET